METKKQSAKKTKVATKVAKKIVEKKVASRKTKVVLASRKPQAKIIAKQAKKVLKKTKTMAAEKKISSAKKVSSHKEPAIKRICYMLLSIILGLLLATFADLFVELIYVKKSMDAGLQLGLNRFLGTYSYLPISVDYIFLLAGLAFGIWLGNWGWNMVYVERRHRMYRKA